MTESALNRTAYAELVARAQREIDEGLLPSCQFAVGYRGEIVDKATLGDTPAGDDSRYVMFSATKGIVVAAMWQLLSEGAVTLDQRVAEIVPEFGTNEKDGVTVEQLLTHRAGFPRAPLGPPAWSDRGERLKAFANWKVNWEPGSRYEYHTTSAHWVLAEIIERIDSEDYKSAIARRITRPLGLNSMAVGVPPEEQGDIARVRNVGEPATAEEWKAALGVSGFDTGEVTDEALAYFAEPEAIAVGVPGGGGVTNASDLALLYQELLHNSRGLWDAGVLADATGHVRVSEPDFLFAGAAANRGLGVIIAGNDGRAASRGFGHTVGPRAFGHNGAGGQVAFADPDSGLSFAYLTNGNDRHLIRQQRRVAGIASRAARCVS